MKKRVVYGFCVITLFLLPSFVRAQDVNSKVNVLSWMSGCWETIGTGPVTTERWARPTENLMLGSSQTVRNGKSVAFEFLRIVNNGQGLTYIAKPSSAKDETPFSIAKVTVNEAVFENLKHDFPQRIIYRLDKPDSLFARIEGMRNGELKGMDIPMKRVKCE
ncbi:MAG: hypothetical protein KIT61_09240 [Pyrinomonadaceae bacterium]|nr:hypothetical protein [Pyrinomonadaceae bacterium]